MKHIDIRIGAVGDPVLFPELASRIKCEGEAFGLAVLEKGMESGATSTTLYVTLPDGKVTFVQISASMFLAMAGAVRGAVDRFGGK